MVPCISGVTEVTRASLLVIFVGHIVQVAIASRPTRRFRLDGVAGVVVIADQVFIAGAGRNDRLLGDRSRRLSLRTRRCWRRHQIRAFRVSRDVLIQDFWLVFR